MPGSGGRGWTEHCAHPTSPITAIVTMPSGERLEGRVEHIDDFTVMLLMNGGQRRTIKTFGTTARVELRDPLQPHKELLPIYTDSDIHNVTAYLVSLGSGDEAVLLPVVAVAATLAVSAQSGIDQTLLSKPLGESWPYNGDYSGRRYPSALCRSTSPTSRASLAWTRRLTNGTSAPGIPVIEGGIGDITGMERRRSRVDPPGRWRLVCDDA